MKIVPVIMAGGAGTRLWPLSRNDKPKQFHNLSGNGSLLEETITRLQPLHPDNYIIATSRDYEKLSRDELHKADVKGVILSEPRPKNTAAAVLYSALYLDKLYDDSIMIVLPADHYIKDAPEFIRVLRLAVEKARENILVTIGITPTYPETGYGYIKAQEGTTGEILPVEKFAEKPNLARAKEYFESGLYFWNSGIFAWKTSVILEYFKKLMPDHVKAFDKLAGMGPDSIASNDPAVWEIKKNIFDEISSVSIDYGILENADKRVVLPGNFGWADLGSWKAIDDILPPDESLNRTPQHEYAIFLDSKNSSVFTEDKRVSIVGLDNIVVVEAGNEILVMHKDFSQDIRKLVEIVKHRASK